MIPSWILILGSTLAAAIAVPLCRRLKPWIAFVILAVFGATISVLVVGIAISAERLANHGTFTAKYLEYSRELRSMVEQGQSDQVSDAILFFDTSVQRSPQSMAALAEAVQAIKAREFGKKGQAGKTEEENIPDEPGL